MAVESIDRFWSSSGNLAVSVILKTNLERVITFTAETWLKRRDCGFPIGTAPASLFLLDNVNFLSVGRG